MFRLEHVNLVVKDIEATKAFLLAAFPHWRVRGDGKSEWYGFPRNWAHIGDDDCYITLNDRGEGKNRDLRGISPGLAHIGFVVDDVNAITERLQKNGYEIGTIGADHPYRKTVYFVEPEGFEFEFIEYFTEDPEKKNMYGGETSDIVRVSTK